MQHSRHKVEHGMKGQRRVLVAEQRELEHAQGTEPNGVVGCQQLQHETRRTLHGDRGQERVPLVHGEAVQERARPHGDDARLRQLQHASDRHQQLGVRVRRRRVGDVVGGGGDQRLGRALEHERHGERRLALLGRTAQHAEQAAEHVQQQRLVRAARVRQDGAQLRQHGVDRAPRRDDGVRARRHGHGRRGGALGHVGRGCWHARQRRPIDRELEQLQSRDARELAHARELVHQRHETRQHTLLPAARGHRRASLAHGVGRQAHERQPRGHGVDGALEGGLVARAVHGVAPRLQHHEQGLEQGAEPSEPSKLELRVRCRWWRLAASRQRVRGVEDQAQKAREVVVV